MIWRDSYEKNLFAAGHCRCFGFIRLAADLYSRLPVTLKFKDFSGMEKIAYFDKRLDEKGQHVGCHPLAGDLCVYQPWGNLSIFYVDFKDDPNLIPIGKLEEGLDVIKAQTGNFTATLEKAE